MDLPKFDYVYNPKDWEATYASDDLCLLDEDIETAVHLSGETVKLETLIQGPAIYGTVIPISLTDDGDIEDGEVRYYATEDEAKEASLTAHAGLRPGPTETY